jgi:hypothetical protein
MSVVNPFVAFYDIHGRQGEVLFFGSLPGTPHGTDKINNKKKLSGGSLG